MGGDKTEEKQKGKKFNLQSTNKLPEPKFGFSVTRINHYSKDDVIVKNTNSEQQILRDEIALLHNQLLYERHRREILGLRNRRLLGKTKNSRALEEQNTSLVRRIPK